MTKGPWKYEEADGHHHVLMGKESLDVNNEDDARMIALVPELMQLHNYVFEMKLDKAFNLAAKIQLQRIFKKK